MTDLSSALPLDRRRMFQLAAVLGGSMALGERALAAPASASASAAPSLKVAPGTIRLNGNEYWEGPVEDGTDAARSAVARSNYYDPAGERDALIETVATMERVGADHVVPWADRAARWRGLLSASAPRSVAW
jgi:histidinol-phosphate aminotransferase